MVCMCAYAMRFVAVVFLIFSEICDCVNSTRAIPKHFLPNSSALITSPRLMHQDTTAHRNLSVYLGYANNPFGPSTQLQHSNKSRLYRGKVPVSPQDEHRHHQQTPPPPHQQIIRFNRTAKYEHHHHQVVDNAIDSAVRPPPYSHRPHQQQQQQQEEPRSKRGVIHLYNMVSCATGCNPLIYKGYGCYCGFLGSGYPVDGIDRCCKMHDWCYDKAKCPSFHEYLIPYYWKCWNGRPICAIDWEDWSPCARNICECDRLLSECLSRYPCPSSRAICRSSTWRLLQNAFMIF